MSKHTPGPWTVEFNINDGWTVWHDPRIHGDMRRGAVVVAAELRASKEAEANARLIAAAPEMLEALQQAFHSLNHDEHPETATKVQAAITKAKNSSHE